MFCQKGVTTGDLTFFHVLRVFEMIYLGPFLSFFSFNVPLVRPFIHSFIQNENFFTFGCSLGEGVDGCSLGADELRDEGGASTSGSTSNFVHLKEMGSLADDTAALPIH